jgi:hypothetical protein
MPPFEDTFVPERRERRWATRSQDTPSKLRDDYARVMDP